MSDNKPKKTILKYLPLVISPIMVAVMLLFVFKQHSFYPFGDKTAAWGDMNQQVVPLLCQLKDILNGRSGWLLSFKNAGGMNFIGVFFFFLSSPFSLLVSLVEKRDMLLFVNILILLKMMTCAAAASLYFIRSDEYKGLGSISISLIGFIYATSGYVMLFYQNVIWLDVMYLFPLLLISLERLHKKGSPLMYIIMMSGIMTVNYYIGYMVVIFLLLLAGVYSIYGIRSDSDGTARASLHFLLGSAAAALLSAAVWLPSFIQYTTSGRPASIAESLTTGALVTDYDTVFPVLFGSAAMLVLAVSGLRISRSGRSSAARVWGIMTILLCVPIVIEPINKVWHTGSYMAFPVRYGFMTIFMLLIMSAYSLDREHKFMEDIKRYLAGGLISAGLVILYGFICAKYIDKDIYTLGEYARSLGGNEASFKGLLRLLITGLLCVLVIYLFYKKGWVIRNIFLIFLSVLTVVEAAGNTRIYMTTSGERNAETYKLQRQILDLSDRIDDDSFYRVKTSGKIFDSNMIGAMGYNSIGHYTSLTNRDYMFTMKRLGYTSVWMEVCPGGGTELTDAMLSIGYEIGHSKPDDTIYSTSGYNIYPLKYKLAPGILTDTLPDTGDIPEELTRAEVQQYVYDALFGSGESIVSKYYPDEGSVSSINGRTSIEQGERLIYRIRINGRQTLYFDCFDRISNELSEPIYDSFSVSVNGGQSVWRSYPYGKENGVLKLGTFEDETVIVEADVLKDVSCASFGVFGIDTGLIGEKCTSANTIGFEEIKNGLSGSADLDEPSEVLLAVPYDSGFTLKVNGKVQPVRKALSCFMSFTLPAGHSDIELTFIPTGLRTGLALSAAGAAAFIIYAVMMLRRKRDGQKDHSGFAAYVSRYLIAGIGIVVFVAVYVIPVALNLIFWKKG